MLAKIHGINIAYDDWGQGQPILLIHGFPLSQKLWHPQQKTLAQSFRTISVDLRGHGESQAIPGPYSMDMLAEDCLALLDYLAITAPVVICGLSMGGYITLAFYRNFPARVSGLILAATRASADSPAAQENRDKAIGLAQQHGSPAIAESMLPKMFAPGTYNTHPALITETRAMMAQTSVPGIVGALQGMKIRPDASSLLPLIQVPTLVLHGAEDQLIPLAVAQDMAAAIPGANLRVIPMAGHLLNLEQPDLFNNAVHSYLMALNQVE